MVSLGSFIDWSALCCELSVPCATVVRGEIAVKHDKQRAVRGSCFV